MLEILMNTSHVIKEIEPFHQSICSVQYFQTKFKLHDHINGSNTNLRSCDVATNSSHFDHPKFGAMFQSLQCQNFFCPCCINDNVISVVLNANHCYLSQQRKNNYSYGFAGIWFAAMLHISWDTNCTLPMYTCIRKCNTDCNIY